MRKVFRRLQQLRKTYQKLLNNIKSYIKKLSILLVISLRITKKEYTFVFKVDNIKNIKIVLLEADRLTE